MVRLPLSRLVPPLRNFAAAHGRRDGSSELNGPEMLAGYLVHGLPGPICGSLRRIRSRFPVWQFALAFEFTIRLVSLSVLHRRLLLGVSWGMTVKRGST